ncbi:peptidoglycan-binding domain-containing protein [Streptomyces sp. YKOK-I1]
MEGIAKHHSRIQAAFAVCAVMATVVLSADPAQASGTYSGRAYIYGGGDWVGDWGDEGDLSTGTNTYSNATCLWQTILSADGYLSVSDVDGIFGSKTKAATKLWQDWKNLDNDGVAGKNTFDKADDKLEYFDSPDDTLRFYYNGKYWQPTIIREASGNYGFYDAAGTYRLAGYNYRTCS